MDAVVSSEMNVVEIADRDEARPKKLIEMRMEQERWSL